VQGDHLGVINVDLTSAIDKTEHGWTYAHDAPLSGQATLQIKDMSWMSQFLGAGINLRGELDAQGTLKGSIDAPDYQAKINGQDLQIAFTDLGILLPNGKLDARIDGSQFTLTSLKFSQAIKVPPKHEYLMNLPWLSQTGYVESTGAVDLKTLRGTINTTWEKFPFLQNPESWMVASGQAQLAESDSSWNLTGKLIADAAYFSVPKQAAPKLSGDVVVLKKNAKRSDDKSGGFQSSLDFNISTGDKFIFVGRGIDTRLDGDIRIRSKNGGTILATGSIQTEGGNYEGYGQQLAIDRGILNFQGPIDNPGLNIRAIRHGLPVEAGVEVLGTVDKPEVRLISEPNVPDPDKLSWLVLGRPSDQMAGSEATLLMSAAGAIFGSDDGSSIPSSIAHTLGIEDLSFGTASTSPESQLPVQTVAGTINSTAPTDQVFSVGKRIAPDIVFSIERSLTDASNGLKLTWQLTRRFSIIGRAGSDTAIDGQYTFSFN
jgi:translocation and assembly module TamB